MSLAPSVVLIVGIISSIALTLSVYYAYKAYRVARIITHTWMPLMGFLIVLTIYTISTVIEHLNISSNLLDTAIQPILMAIALTFLLSFHITADGEWFDPLTLESKGKKKPKRK